MKDIFFSLGILNALAMSCSGSNFNSQGNQAPLNNQNNSEASEVVVDSPIANKVSVKNKTPTPAIEKKEEPSSGGNSAEIVYTAQPYQADPIPTNPPVVSTPENKVTADAPKAEGSIVEATKATATPTPTSTPDPVKEIQAAMDGLRWDLPCLGPFTPGACSATNNFSTSTTLKGNASKQYKVLLRFRGIVEDKVYNNPSFKDGFWVKDGTPANDFGNVYSLQISNPPQTYYLNATTYNERCCTYAIDFTREVTVSGGALITMSASALDGGQLTPSSANIVKFASSGDVKVIDGQFIQMNVLSITPAN